MTVEFLDTKAFQSKMEDLNARLKYYEVVEAYRVLAEDGKYKESVNEHQGYAIVNKATGIIEHTTMVLPGAIFQAESLDSMLGGLLEPPVDAPKAEGNGEDVIPLN